MLRRTALVLVATLLVASGLTVVGGSAAVAAEVCKAWVADGDGRLTYTVVPCPSEGGGGPGSDGSGGGSGPACYLGRQAAFDYDVAFCRGELSCYQYIPSAAFSDPDSWPDRPDDADPDAVYANQACFSQPPAEDLVSNDYLWIVPDEATLAQQADEAYGALDAPAFAVAFSPATRALVGLPTWFWADGATAGELRGSSAAGLVAVATPDHMEVDPGDGSGAQDCAFSVAASDACSATYERSSAGQTARSASGDPAYTARMRLVYTVAFVRGGAPMTIPGAPTQFTSQWHEMPVPVAEVQAVVTAG